MKFIGIDSRLPASALQLKPRVQKKNASLAIAATEAWLVAKAPAEHRALSREDIDVGVQQWSWPGRFQIISDGNITWFLDAAHNDMSIEVAAQWFAEASKDLDNSDMVEHVLMFSHMSMTRDAEDMLNALGDALNCHSPRIKIDRLVMTTYETSDHEKACAAVDATSFYGFCLDIFGDGINLWEELTIEGAWQRVRGLGREKKEAGGTVHCFVTGSQHLIGPVLGLLQSADGRASEP